MSGVGSVSAEQAVWNLPATLSVQQGGNIPLRQYALNSDGWQILVSNLPAGVTYNSGLERLEGAATGTSSGTATFTLSRVGGSDVVATATVALTDPSLIVPALTVEYVDTSGVRQTTPVVDGVTTITGTAPFLVQFDASGTRAPAAYAAQSTITDNTWGSSEEAHAFLMVGYRMHYGESLGGVWQYPEGSSYSRDEDTGPPLFGRVYTQVGAHQARLRVRDVLGNEQTISCNVVVSAPATTVHIPVSQGSWPSWVSGTRYTLDAGGDYRPFGTMGFAGLHNIIIEKVGVGADPRVASFSPESRDKFSATGLTEYRSAHIRLVNIDFDVFSESQRGYDYVGIIGGYVRRYAAAGHNQLWAEHTDVARSNVRIPRGLFVRDSVMSNIGQSDSYIHIGLLRSWHATNTRFMYSESLNQSTHSVLRTYCSHCTFRNNLWYLEALAANGGSYNGIAASIFGQSGRVETEWRDDDTLGPFSSTSAQDRYGYRNDKSFIYQSQFYGEGSFICNAVLATGGNKETSVGGNLLVRPRLVGFENNVWYPAGAVGLQRDDTLLAGNYLFWRNNRRDMGVGTYLPAGSTAPNVGDGVNDTVTFNGPYFIENANSRPVPAAF